MGRCGCEDVDSLPVTAPCDVLVCYHDMFQVIAVAMLLYRVIWCNSARCTPVDVPQEGIAVAVASPDKDFFQLLRPGIILLRSPKKPAPGERINKYALVPYSQADFEEVGGVDREQPCLAAKCGCQCTSSEWMGSSTGPGNVMLASGFGEWGAHSSGSTT